MTLLDARTGKQLCIRAAALYVRVGGERDCVRTDECACVCTQVCLRASTHSRVSEAVACSQPFRSGPATPRGSQLWNRARLPLRGWPDQD